MRQRAGWLTRPHTGEFPPVVSLRPDGDHPGRAHVVADLPRVAAIVQRVAAEVDEPARARRVADLGATATGPDWRAGRRLGRLGSSTRSDPGLACATGTQVGAPGCVAGSTAIGRFPGAA